MVRTGPSAWLSPIYPYLLAGLFKLFGTYSYESNICIHTIDCAFTALTCLPIWAIGKKAFGKRTGVAAAWLWVILPTSLFYPIVWVWDTSLSALWMALLVLATFELRGRDRMPAWVGYGALWGIGALINPSLLPVLPPLALWAIWPLRRQLLRSARLATASAAIFVVCLAPWTIRNYMAFHTFVPLRSNFGLELWLGNNPDVPDTWTPQLHPNDDPVEAKKYAAMTELPYMQEKQREALAFMRSHPRDTMRFFFRRFADTWIGVWDSPTDIWGHLPTYYKFILVSNILFSLLSLLGVLLAYRKHSEWGIPFASIVLIFPMVFYITHPSQRYRFPMDPILTVLTIYTLGCLLSWVGELLSAGKLQPQASATSIG
jgi:4-amino-4-deoxy-L-arabinose transferase-like glycosyltransferase